MTGHVRPEYPVFILQRQLANLGVQRRQVHRLWLRATTEDVCRPLKQLLLPLRDLRGWTSNCLHSSAMALSSRIAARATRALNTAVCVRRVRRADFFTIKNSFSPDHPRPSHMPGVSTYRAVQIRGATSPRVVLELSESLVGFWDYDRIRSFARDRVVAVMPAADVS